MADFVASITSEQLETDPFPVFARLRREAPVAWVPAAGRWMVTRWADVRQVLSSPQSFVAVSDSPVARICGRRTMVSNEGDWHAELRASVDHLFTGEAVPRVVAITREVAVPHARALDGRDRAELMGDYFGPVIAGALGRLMGLDDIAPVTLLRWSEQMMAGFADPAALESGTRAVAEIDLVVQPLLERAGRDPGGSLLDHFVRTGCPAGAHREPADVVPTVANMISTFIEPVHMAGMTLLVLCQHPDQFDAVRAQPDRMDDAVREAMRYSPVIGAPGRRTAGPVRLAGVDLPDGAFVGAVIASANRDERMYPDADTFDIDRRQPTISLGYGRHRCLLAPIMPALIATSLRVLLERFGDARIAPSAEAPRGWKVRKLDSLTVHPANRAVVAN